MRIADTPYSTTGGIPQRIICRHANRVPAADCSYANGVHHCIGKHSRIIIKKDACMIGNSGFISKALFGFDVENDHSMEKVGMTAVQQVDARKIEFCNCVAATFY